MKIKISPDKIAEVLIIVSTVCIVAEKAVREIVQALRPKKP